MSFEAFNKHQSAAKLFQTIDMFSLEKRKNPEHTVQVRLLRYRKPQAEVWTVLSVKLIGTNSGNKFRIQLERCEGNYQTYTTVVTDEPFRKMVLA